MSVRVEKIDPRAGLTLKALEYRGKMSVRVEKIVPSLKKCPNVWNVMMARGIDLGYKTTK